MGIGAVPMGQFKQPDERIEANKSKGKDNARGRHKHSDGKHHTLTLSLKDIDDHVIKLSNGTQVKVCEMTAEQFDAYVINAVRRIYSVSPESNDTTHYACGEAEQEVLEGIDRAVWDRQSRWWAITELESIRQRRLHNASRDAKSHASKSVRFSSAQEDE